MNEDLLLEPREVPLGGVRGLTVHRTLPHRGLPTVGAWCFVDHFGPTRDPMKVLPHPHTGLQTVTWPFAGDIRHRDNLGSDVVLRPGELNLMTSGDGVSHSEVSVGGHMMMHGLQLWVALPDGSRTGPAAFEHLPDLPRTGGDGWRAIVLVGRLADIESPATTYSPIVGAELTLGAGAAATVPLQPEFEHAVLAVDGPVRVGGYDVTHRQMQYLAPGRDSVKLAAARDTTVRADRRNAVRRVARHVVELHRPKPRRHRASARGLGAGRRAIRHRRGSRRQGDSGPASAEGAAHATTSSRLRRSPQCWRLVGRSGTVSFGYCRYLKSERNP